MKSIKKIRKTSYRRKFRNTRRTNRKTYKKVKRGGYDDRKLEQMHRIKIGTLINALKEKIKNEVNINDDIKKEISFLIRSVFVYRNMLASNLKFSDEQEELYINNSKIGENRSPTLDRDVFFEKYNDKPSLNKLLENLESDFDNAVIVAKKKLNTQDEQTNPSAESQKISDNSNYNDYADNHDNTLETPLISKKSTTPSSSSSMWKMFGF